VHSTERTEFVSDIELPSKARVSISFNFPGSKEKSHFTGIDLPALSTQSAFVLSAPI